MRLFVLCFALFALQAMAQTPEPKTSKLSIGSDHGSLFVREFCSFGTQFVAVVQDKRSSSNGSGGVAVVQVLAANGKPMDCNNKPSEVK